jgi:hypothetical protein
LGKAIVRLISLTRHRWYELAVASLQIALRKPLSGLDQFGGIDDRAKRLRLLPRLIAASAPLAPRKKYREGRKACGAFG